MAVAVAMAVVVPGGGGLAAAAWPPPTFGVQCCETVLSFGQVLVGRLLHPEGSVSQVFVFLGGVAARALGGGLAVVVHPQRHLHPARRRGRPAPCVRPCFLEAPHGGSARCGAHLSPALAVPGRTIVLRHEGGEGSAARHGGVQRRAAAGTGSGKWVELTWHCQIWLPR